MECVEIKETCIFIGSSDSAVVDEHLLACWNYNKKFVKGFHISSASKQYNITTLIAWCVLSEVVFHSAL